MYVCANCGNVHEEGTKIVTLEETFPVKGEPTSVLSTVRLCEVCNEPIYDRDLDVANLARAFDAYRAKHDIVSPADVKALREMYGLTQRGLSTLLGMGEITIHRYESGSIPDEAHNQLLVMMKDPWNMREVLVTRGECLPASQRKKAMIRVEQLIQQESPEKMLELAVANVSHRGPDLYTGYLPFQPEKLMEMMLFFTRKPGGVFKTKLNKLLWYADFLHYRYYGVSVSGTSYVHMPFGPCADQYNFFLSHLLKENALEAKEIFFENGSGEKLIALTDEENTLSSSALEVMTAVHEHFASVSSKDISALSHDEKGYLNTNEGEVIPYSYADELNVNISDKIPSLSHL